jgi:hypothetical protein
MKETEKSNTLKNAIKKVYTELKEREIHPSGSFDQQGRWYAKNQDLISVRSPSREYPFSEMTACRTLKYVKRVAEKYNAKSYKKLARLV